MENIRLEGNIYSKWPYKQLDRPQEKVTSTVYHYSPLITLRGVGQTRQPLQVYGLWDSPRRIGLHQDLVSRVRFPESLRVSGPRFLIKRFYYHPMLNITWVDRKRSVRVEDKSKVWWVGVCTRRVEDFPL